MVGSEKACKYDFHIGIVRANKKRVNVPFGAVCGGNLKSAGGDVTAWEPLVRTHQETVFRLSYLLFSDPDDVPDFQTISANLEALRLRLKGPRFSEI